VTECIDPGTSRSRYVVRLNDDLLCQSPDKSAASERLKGLSVEKAEQILRRTPCSLRLVELDGRSLAVTSDMVGTRINVVVRDGVIARIDGLY
jgi:hypothetical protein